MTEYEKNARIFKALGDANRLYILSMLQSGEKCACKLLEALKIGQPTLSHHMKLLCDAGIVTGRREGKWTHYSLNPDGLRHAGELLLTLNAALPENSECQCKGDD
ncbi:MAG: metalloregulator ArsR/SmtB family transcription factor [Eubacteriales bacterium]|nr:metalloregulator ArsR/SmtB family transcription factor [Eubacteriales bacterium]